MKTAAICALTLITATAGCTAATAGPFTSPGTQPLTCMQHQPNTPGADYTDPAKQKLAADLQVLRYYTTNGDRPYCDHKPPTTNDNEWARIYLKLGADPKHLHSVLHQ